MSTPTLAIIWDVVIHATVRMQDKDGLVEAHVRLPIHPASLPENIHAGLVQAAQVATPAPPEEPDL